MDDYRVNDISYRYTKEDEEVLKHVNFSIEKGKVTAIVGPSGCGKSTLVQIFSQVIPKIIDKGELSGSFDVPEDTFVSVVSQNPENQLFGYGVEDAIAFGLENIGMSREYIVERMEYVLNLLNLQYLRKRSVDNLSGGQRQSVCIASVLAMKPDILIMDEPVSSLDPNGKKMVQDILGQLSKNGNTVVLVDNNLVWSAGVVDHVIGLLDGNVVFDGSRDDFFENFELQEKLGVILPQEVELYRELSRKFQKVQLFCTVEDAWKQLKENVKKGVLTEKKTANQATEDLEEPIIRVQELVKQFQGDFLALDHVNAKIPKRKVIAVLGQNGSGKTTFVRHLNGLYKPNSGEILYKERSILGKTVAQISKNIILVFQHPEHMLFEETVEKELTFCARMQDVPFSEDAITKVLEHYGLEEERETFPLNLSMGKKHLLTILSVLFSSADVIILDEPTLGMDGFLIGALEKMIEELKAAGKTVIMISHEIPLVFRVSDYAVVLNKGEKLFEGTKEELVNQEELFEQIHIKFPPVVQLSKKLGLDEIAYQVDDFVEKVTEQWIEEA